MIQFEKEIIAYLGLPSIPARKHDGKTSFDKGVAVLELFDDRYAYAVCSFDATTDAQPRINKVFGTEPFLRIKEIFVVPNYMSNIEDIKDMDLTEDSKKKAEELLREAKELENEGVEEDNDIVNPKNEYYFDNITNDDEAKAFIQAYNSRNRIKGRIPTTHDGLVMRLAVIYSDTKKASK